MRRAIVISIVTIIVLVSGAVGWFIQKQMELRWLNETVMHFYEKPEPDKVPLIMVRAASAGVLDREDTKWIFTTFLSELMRKDPDRIKGWLVQLKTLTPSQNRLVWAALWQSGATEGIECLKEIETTAKGEDKRYITEMLSRPAVPFEKKDITSCGALDLLWTCFFATGEEKYVNRIIDSLPLPDTHGTAQLMLGGSAEWSLTANARVHPRVMQICQEAQRARPELALKLLDVIEKANKAR